MSSTRALAVAQTTPLAGDVPANLIQHLDLARRAADHGAALVLFPELSLTGYELERAGGLAFSVDDARLDGLGELATARDTTLVVGLPLRVDDGVGIAALALTPDGRRRPYTKRHLGAFPESARADLVAGAAALPPAEDTVCVAGDRDPLLTSPAGPAALAICADAHRAGHAGAAAARGARAYLVGMFVIPTEAAAARAQLADRARRHGLLVGAANFGGPSGGLASAGGSGFLDPDGVSLVSLPRRGPGLALARHGDDGWHAEAIGPVP